MRHLILIGFMGSGKTSLGKRLAKALGRPFVDTDQQVEKTAGKKISDIFQEEGESGFRRRETEALAKLKEEKKPCVISVGGGLPVQPQNHLLLEQLGTVIYLEAPVEVLEQRLAGDTGRPLLAGGDLHTRIVQLMEQREEIYQEVADLIVQTGGKSFEELITEVKKRTEHL